jgi:drug/metabolite transporter (DMT)-like permease
MVRYAAKAIDHLNRVQPLTIDALPYILLQGLLFGSTLIVSRFIIGQLHPITYIGLRMVLASLGHIALYLLDRRRRRWPTDARLWRRAALLGVGTVVPMMAVVSALQYQSAGLTSVLLTSSPAITVLLAHFFLPDETLTARKGTGVALALGGALLLAMRGESGLPDVEQASPLGYGLVLLAICFISGTAIYARKFMRDFDAFGAASARMFAATLAVMSFSVPFVGVNLQGVNSEGYLALGYAAFAGTFGGLLLSFHNVKRFGATAESMTTYVIPIVGTLGGALVLDERITAGMVIGMGLIAAGIALINQQERGE